MKSVASKQTIFMISEVTEMFSPYFWPPWQHGGDPLIFVLDIVHPPKNETQHLKNKLQKYPKKALPTAMFHGTREYLCKSEEKIRGRESVFLQSGEPWESIRLNNQTEVEPFSDNRKVTSFKKQARSEEFSPLGSYGIPETINQTMFSRNGL